MKNLTELLFHDFTMKNQIPVSSSSGSELELSRMPGHWMLARMGKRVLRPGGLELTRKLLAHLEIEREDSVVEFAPGLGLTARLTLANQPRRYIAVERDADAAKQMRQWLTRPEWLCIKGDAADTGLPPDSANIVYGEAMLSMHGQRQKAAIIREAFRLLQPGGRYGIHELAITPDEAPVEIKNALTRELSDSIRVGARPLTVEEWQELFQSEGFVVERAELAPMYLLEPMRLIHDEGFFRACRFAWNVWRTPVARHRVIRMRRVFRRYQENLHAIMLVARKPD